MDNNKDDKYYINEIKSTCERILSTTKNISIEEFKEDINLVDSTAFRLVQISEICDKISKEYKQSHKNISWAKIKGLRNRLVHDYGNINFKIIYNTILKDFPDLMKNLD